MSKLFEVFPLAETPIKGVLSNGNDITKPMVLQLDEKKFNICMDSGRVYAINGTQKILIPKGQDYATALEECNKPITRFDNGPSLSGAGLSATL